MEEIWELSLLLEKPGWPELMFAEKFRLNVPGGKGVHKGFSPQADGFYMTQV